MKIAFVFRRNGREPVLTDEGDPQAIPVFRWFVKIGDGQGRWEVHFAAHISATTEDFKFQQFQGLFVVGRGSRGFWVEFAPGERVFHIGAKHA